MKVAFSGTHGTGKTTSVYQYATDLKLKNSVMDVGILSEVARHSPLPINKETSQMSQLWIFTNQCQQEIAKSVHYDVLVCDRTIWDCIAYTSIADVNLAKQMIELSRPFIPTYDKIFFKTAKNNPYCFDDGVREVTDTGFRQTVEDILLGIYDDLKIKYEII